MPSVVPLNTITPSDLEPFSRVQLIVADLDGTLLDPTWSVIDLIQSQIPRLRHHGVRFTIATGRAIRGVAKVLPRLGLTASTPLALYNGSLCIDVARRQILHSRVIPAVVAARAVEWGLTLGHPVLCYPQLVADSDGFRESPMGFTPDGSPSKRSEPNGYEIEWLGPESADSVPDCLAILVDLRGSDGSARPHTHFGHADVSITESGSSFLEIRPARSNKGTAIAAIARRLRLPLSAVLAIGDNDNDVELLRTVGLGVAVGNASTNLQSAAAFSTSLPAAQGCLEVIRLVIAARRYRAASLFRVGDGSP